MKLEIGSGDNPTEGYEHLDINPNAPHVEYVGDIRALLSKDYNIDHYPDLKLLREQKFEVIKATHVIEHVQWIYQDVLFALLYDLLDAKGLLCLETPDLKWIAKSYLKNISKKRFPITEHPDLTEDKNALQFYKWINFKLYSGCSPGDYHHCCYDKEFLTELLLLAGFDSLSIKARGGTLSGIARKLDKAEDKESEYFNP